MDMGKSKDMHTRVIENGMLFREDFEREYLRERYLIQQQEEEWYNEQSKFNNSKSDTKSESLDSDK